jgi:RimJ/RimL family protein N-acetyltransferase
MPGGPFLRGERVTLRPVEPADYDFVARHWNDAEIRHGFARHSPHTRERIAEFVESDDAVHLLPCREGAPVGYLWLFGVDDVARRAELGYWIAPDNQGRGLATETVRLGVRYAFDERGLNKVTARVFDWNTASQRVLEKLGFEREGHLRDHYYVDGEFVDAYLYSRFADDRRAG